MHPRCVLDKDATDEDATDKDSTDKDATDEDAMDEDAADEDAYLSYPGMIYMAIVMIWIFGTGGRTDRDQRYSKRSSPT